MSTVVLQPGAAPRPGPRGGRRQVTIMFVDLVGSTALSHQLDPEDYEELLGRYRQLCEAGVLRFGGRVEQFQGDGVVCCFGYPAAHEDDPARAVRAALQIVQAVGLLSHAGAGAPLAARVGIATGLSVVDMPPPGGGGAGSAIGGETPNIAARVQALAPPGGVAVADSTRRLVLPEFDLASLGMHALKGVPRPEHLWLVLGPRNVASRFAARSQSPVPVVGRDAEMAALLGWWQRAASGEGQAVLISGEAGIGKSHLVRELSLHPRTRSTRFVLFQCSPYYENTAYWPLVKRLQDELAEIEALPGQELLRLEAYLALAGIDDADALPLVAQLLSLDVPRSFDAAASYSPEKRRDRTAEILVGIALGPERSGPALIVFEDMHWADPSTVELAARIADRLPTASALLVLSFRPEFDVAPLARFAARHVALEPLSADAAAALIRTLSPGRRLPDEIVHSILDKTDGVPLFVEELTRSVLESGLLRDAGDRYEIVDEVGGMAIPATLQDSLMARLDRLGAVREIAQIGAAIGREFSSELLSTVTPIDGPALADALERLVSSGLVAAPGPGARGVFVFKHALIQDAAYESMLKSTRQHLHGRLATALVAGWPATGETEPEILARHLTRAGRTAEAAPLWLRAGQRALVRSALVEAIAHFTTALSLVAALPRTPELDELELEIRVGLGGAYIAQRGWASDRVRHTAGPARVLAAHTRNVQHLVTTHFQVWVNFQTRCQFPSALEVADELIEQGRQRSDPSLLAHGYGMSAQTLYFIGRFAESLSRMQICADLSDFDRDRKIVVNTNHEVRASSEARVGTAHWILGYPDRAVRSARDTIDCARRTGHAFNLAFVLAINSHSFFSLGDVATAAAHIDEALGIAANQRLASLERMTLPLYEGRKLLYLGRPADGARVTMPALEAMRRDGQQRITVSSNLAMLGQMLAGAGDAPAGLARIEDGIAWSDETGDVFELAELWRLRGEVLERLDRPADAQDSYRRALAIARGQEAQGWVLRAATSLARLWQAHDPAAADALLRPVHDWFGEGLDTPDLRRARRLLDALATG